MKKKIKCERCSKKFKIRNLTEKFDVRACSYRCAERVWDMCPECLEAFIDFMDSPSAKKLTPVEINEQMKTLVASIDREMYIHNPYYHHTLSLQMNALRCGRPDWRLFGGLR